MSVTGGAASTMGGTTQVNTSNFSGGSVGIGGRVDNQGGNPSGGQPVTGGTNAGGQPATGGADSGGQPATGGASSGFGGGSTAGSGGQPSCIPSSEICDGLDNNCSGDTSDEQCPTDCVGYAFAGKGYMFCSIRGKRAEAAAACHDSANRNLVEITSEAQNSFLVTQGSALNWLGPWIGASDIATDGDWRWANGTPFWSGDASGTSVGNRYSRWAPGNPNDGEAGQDCGILCTQLTALACDSIGVWNDVSCNVERRGYICAGL